MEAEFATLLCSGTRLPELIKAIRKDGTAVRIARNILRTIRMLISGRDLIDSILAQNSSLENDPDYFHFISGLSRSNSHWNNRPNHLDSAFWVWPLSTVLIFPTSSKAGNHGREAHPICHSCVSIPFISFYFLLSPTRTFLRSIFSDYFLFC